MRLREPEMPLDPEIARELEAVDLALAGESVEPDLEAIAELARDLHAERPEPSAEAEAMLDELAASDFSSRASDRFGRVSGRASKALAGLRRLKPRRLAPAFAGAAVLLVAVGVAVSGSGIFSGGGETISEPVAPGSPPSVIANGGSHGPAADASRAELQAGPAGRKVARRIDLDLTTTPGDFRDAADGVFDVVRAHRGYVVTSQVSGGDPAVDGAEQGRATFALRIPAQALSAAIGDLSDLGHVVSRSDGSVDVTKRFVSARDRVDGLSAARDRLLRELGEAPTAAEHQSIRARLRIVERRLAAARRDLAGVRQRVDLVPVSVTINADDAGSSGGAWSIGDALHDAGRVLTVIAGAAVVGAAALLPLALLIALLVAGRRAWTRRQRGRALDGAAG
jgi:hypothetical protein